MNRNNRKSNNKESRSNRLKDIMKKLENGVKDLFTSEKYQKYLRTMSQFHKYSFSNTLLIALQRPDATLVTGYGAWQKKFHRQVKKGEKGITILAPIQVKDTDDTDKENIHLFFRPVSVFDISQTEGEPLPSLGVDELVGSVEGFSAFMQAMTALSPVPIRFDEIESGAKGYYNTVLKEIVIKKGMSESQTMKTCVHEVSHAILHDRDRMKAEGLKKNRQTKEVEAESVAFSVCSYLNLDTGDDYSFPYIAGWSSSMEMKELKASMDTIRKTAGELIEGIETELEKQKKLELSQKKEEKERPSVLAALVLEKNDRGPTRASKAHAEKEMVL